ncbi:MAG: RNA 2',3'-cyclic phosphodiesterase [Actinobacteria bacterium]|nr:RNA 2',3'-cyclic phosphodiesterase [Actinomycetota bacterium]
MRLFIAAELPSSIKEELSSTSEELRPHMKGRFVAPDLYHVTLAFIGEKDEKLFPRICETVKDACAKHEPFEVALGGLGFFGKRDSATLWYGLRETSQIEMLAKDIHTGLAKNGITFDEKPFHPHVTLARKVSINDTILAECRGCSSGPVDTVTLYRSVTIDGILSYLPLAQIALNPVARR